MEPVRSVDESARLIARLSERAADRDHAAARGERDAEHGRCGKGQGNGGRTAQSEDSCTDRGRTTNDRESVVERLCAARGPRQPLPAIVAGDRPADMPARRPPLRPGAATPSDCHRSVPACRRRLSSPAWRRLLALVHRDFAVARAALVVRNAALSGGLAVETHSAGAVATCAAIAVCRTSETRVPRACTRTAVVCCWYRSPGWGLNTRRCSPRSRSLGQHGRH